MVRKVLSAFWPSFRMHWISWAVALVGMIVSVSLQAVSPYYLRNIVEEFTGKSPNMVLVGENFLRLLLLGGTIIIFYRLFGAGLLIHEARAMKDIESRCFAAIQRQSMRFFENEYSGSLITRARRFTASYEAITDLFFFQFARNFIMIFVIMAAFIDAMPALTIPFIIWIAVFIGYNVIANWLKFSLDRKRAELDSAVGAALSDSFTNHMVVKTFGREVSEQKRFDAIVHESYLARFRSWFWSEIIITGQALITATAELGLIWWMIGAWEKGLVTAGDFVFAQTFLIWAVGHLWMFGQNLRRLFAAFADAEEMANIFHLTPEVCDAPGARPLFIERGEIEFHSVVFSYGGSSNRKNAIDDLTLVVPAGQSIGLVGRSGSGKSTLVKLLLHTYDLDAGYIAIDGCDIANVTQASLRQQLAVVPQKPTLFHRTIRENIAFACPDATEADIIAAAKKACAWNFIQELEGGLDMLVGERGAKLSGGQEQRIAFARAILADPPILILDEATSSLDGRTEMLIQQATANLLHGRTAIVVAHRLSTIAQLDRIVVLDGGKIVEEGTHDELRKIPGGLYADLWSHQIGGYINA